MNSRQLTTLVRALGIFLGLLLAPASWAVFLGSLCLGSLAYSAYQWAGGNTEHV